MGGHSCLGSQANSRCPSFPAHHCTSSSLLLAAVTRLATSCSRASQELRPPQAPSSQQANAPLNYCCLAVFSRLQSRESAESTASHDAPAPDQAPRRRQNLAAPHPPTQATSAPACPADPGAPPATGTQDGGAGLGRRRALGWAGTRAPARRPRGPARPTSVPAARKAMVYYYGNLSRLRHSIYQHFIPFFKK